MTQLSTEVKNTVIIFHDGSRKFITNRQADIVISQSTTAAKGIKIDGSFIAFSSISKILTLQEFYNEYPDERPPETQNKVFTTPAGDMLDRVISPLKLKQQRIRAFEQMIKGIKKYIDSDKNQGTGKPEILLAHMERKLNLIYDSPIN